MDPPVAARVATDASIFRAVSDTGPAGPRDRSRLPRTGAILRFAVTASVAGIDIQTVGTILIVVGVVGFAISLFLWIASRDDQGRRTQPPPL